MTDNLDPLTPFDRLVVGMALFHYFIENEPDNLGSYDPNPLIEKFHMGWSYASMIDGLKWKNLKVEGVAK